MERMRDQAIVCNIGHFDNEIQVDKLIAFPESSKPKSNHRSTNIPSPTDTRSSCWPKDV